jgi:hypothetical protein
MKKPILLLVPCLLLVLQSCEQKKDLSFSDTVSKKAPILKKTITAQPDSVSIIAVGDIMLGTSYPNNSTLPPDSAKNSFAAIKTELHNADVTFGNLEGPLLDGGKPAFYKTHLKTSYIFRMPRNNVNVLKEAGFKVVSLANNHIGDFDDRGRQSTMRALDSPG